MNSYFASVEQQANPFFRGRPLGVCAYLHPRGCVIAASVEAKRMGAKVGMTVMEARRLVPGMIFVQTDPAKYRSVTSRIFTVLQTLTDKIEYYSIDEAFLDLTGWYRDSAESAFALSRVKQRMCEEIGEWLRCSVGIAPTKFLAKFASDRRKPDGLVIIESEKIPMWLHVPVEEAWGIGPRLGKRLARLGIVTLHDLREASPTNLLQSFGVQGYFLWCHVQGIECDPFALPGVPPKSIGHSYCVPQKVSRDGSIEAVLTKLTERVGRRLRTHLFLSSKVVITIHHINEHLYRHATHLFPQPIDDSFTLVSEVVKKFRAMRQQGEIDFLSVTCIDLSRPTKQLELVVDDSLSNLHERRLRSVSHSMDHIRDRYGQESIVLGRMLGAMGNDHAPDRIGFRKIDGVAVSEFPAYSERVVYDTAEENE